MLESLAVAGVAGAVAAAVTIGALRSDMQAVKERLRDLTKRVGLLESLRRA